MARVPVVVENGQTLRPLTGERFDAPDIGMGGRALAQGMQGFGQAISRAGEQQEEIDTIYAEARAKEGDNRWNEAVRDMMFGEEGFYRTRGQNTVNSQKTTAERLTKLKGELLNNTADWREREMLEGVLEKRLSEELDGMARYTVGQQRSFAVEQSNARVENARENYTRFVKTDPDRARQERATMLSEVRRRAELEGFLDADIIASLEETALSDMHAATIEAEMQGDPVAAGVYLDKHRDEIDPKTWITLDGRLQPLLVDSDADKFAEELAGNFTTSVAEVDVPASGPSTATRTQGGTTRAVNRSARPTGAPANPGAMPKSYKDAAWRPLEESMERKYGLREGLLADIRLKGERSNANQVSSAGARGVFQFIPSTRQAFIKKYGIDPWRSPQEQVEAAAIHLRDDIARYGSERAAVAAYNGGHRGVTNPAKETRDYLSRIYGGGGGDGEPVAAAGPSRGTVIQQDLQRQLEMVEPTVREKLADKPPRYQDMVIENTKAKLRRRAAEEIDGIQVQEQAAWEGAMETVLSLGGSFTSLSQIPNYHTLTVGQRTQLSNLASANTERVIAGAEPETDWMFYAEVQRIANEDPASLRYLPMGEARAKLGDTEFKEVSKLVGKPPAKGSSPKARTFSEILSISKLSLQSAGFVVGDSKDAAKDAPAVKMFGQRMVNWANSFHQTNDRWPTSEEIRGKGDQFLIDMVYDPPGPLGTRRGKAFEMGDIDPSNPNLRVVVPPAIEERIRAQLPAGATDGDVRRLYVQGVGKGRW